MKVVSCGVIIIDKKTRKILACHPSLQRYKPGCFDIPKGHVEGNETHVQTALRELEEEAYHFLKPYYEEGLDGIIIQDLGLLNLLKEAFPKLPIHGSTQMTITNALGAKMLEGLGVERVVTARELSLREIEEIHNNVDIEIESFIHGAMCYSYSGMCLFSSIIGGRSGNRGRCAGPCRQPYGAG